MGTRGTRKSNIVQSVLQQPESGVVLLRSASDLRNLGRQNGCYSGLALDVEKLIQFIPGVRLEYSDFDSSLSGSLTKQGEEWIVRVNKSHNKARQRFTIGHELGHYVYHKDDENDFVDTAFFRGKATDNLEYTANRFASELLMPEEEVRQLIDKENVRSVADLAQRFGVSSAAMLHRVKELKYITKE